MYRPLFELVWGADFHISWPVNTEKICTALGGAARFGGSAKPIRLSSEDRTKANNIYDHWGQSISKYERSNRLSPFTSKFDAFLKGKYTLTPSEMAGYELFKGKANCNSCHLDGRSTTLAPDQTDTGGAGNTRPLFTCFGYANLGLPLNPRNPLFYQTTSDRFGFTPPMASVTETWDWEPFSEALPTRTYNGRNLPPAATARCRHQRRAMRR